MATALRYSFGQVAMVVTAVLTLSAPLLAGSDGGDAVPASTTDLHVTTEAHAAAIAALEQAGYALVTRGGRPDSTDIRIEKAGRLVIAERGLDFALIGPADMTGDGVENLLLVVAPDLMRPVRLSLLVFGQEGLATPPISDDLERKLRERLQIGHLTEIVEPRDSAGRYWNGTSVDNDIDPDFEFTNPYPDMSARMAELGYELAHDDDGLRLLRYGTEVWSEQAWMLSAEGPRDYTTNGWPNLLVFKARGRSFRGTSLLELAEDGVTIIWSVDGHVNKMHPFEAELGRVISEGGSLEQISGAPAPNGFDLETVLPAID